MLCRPNLFIRLVEPEVVVEGRGGAVRTRQMSELVGTSAGARGCLQESEPETAENGGMRFCCGGLDNSRYPCIAGQLLMSMVRVILFSDQSHQIVHLRKDKPLNAPQL
ncbi:hypothetical protein C0Q70_06242 [Pomacea canaliculata]|uniref:Uncharacterized protein n=1 Tax=Pomacea canaliculata TaxID=400727 RepID=A0A2T7PNG1_POMCA|nr:hypothetical protein C0Q70_06242 [Pomacea canaliculata]